MHKKFYWIGGLPSTEDGKAPEWILLFKAGWGKLVTGEKFLVDRTGFDLVCADIAGRANEVVVDYEHAAVMGERKPTPASGWIKELKYEDGSGIMARIEWTETAEAMIAKKEYRYFSPVFGVRKTDGRICALDSVALTNRPRTYNLTPIVAGLPAGIETEKETIMDLKQLIASLGLKDDATAAEILTAVAALGIKLPEEKTKEVVPAGIIAALGLKETDDTSTIVAGIHALKQAGTGAVSREEFLRLQASLAERDATDAVDAAMKTGKIAPAQKNWAMNYAKMDIKGFNTFVAMATVVIPVNQLPAGPKQEKEGELSESTILVASQMGVSKEDIIKYGLEVKHG